MSHLQVKIQYGILGGERLGGKLRRELRRAGYNITRDRSKADIIIAHSAGCFWLPKSPSRQKLVLIDPPYWPDKTIKERAHSRLRNNFHFRRYGYGYVRWVKRNLWGWYYAIRDIKRTRYIIKQAAFYDLSKLVGDPYILLIRNRDDEWLTPDLDHLKIINPNIIIKELSGDHEDWYHNPQPYVDLIKSVYGTGK